MIVWPHPAPYPAGFQVKGAHTHKLSKKIYFSGCLSDNLSIQQFIWIGLCGGPYAVLGPADRAAISRKRILKATQTLATIALAVPLRHPSAQCASLAVKIPRIH